MGGTDRLLRRMLVAALSLGLFGCSADFEQVLQKAIDNTPLVVDRNAAENGDPLAQLNLGNSYCCADATKVVDRTTGKDNRQATHWLCLAARQDNGAAQLRLARLYAGQLFGGAHLPVRMVYPSVPPQHDMVIALIWARRATMSPDLEVSAEAASFLRGLSRAFSTEEQRQAAHLAENWPRVPCEWDEVFVAAR